MDDKLYITLCRLYLEAIEFAEKLDACITSNLDPSLPRSFTVPKRKILGGASMLDDTPVMTFWQKRRLRMSRRPKSRRSALLRLLMACFARVLIA